MLVLLALVACRSRGAADTDDTVSADPFAGVDLVSSDADTFADVGYEVDRFEITEAYRTIFDTDPAFYVLRPTVAPEGELPVLLWLHGGALGDDSEGLPGPCVEAEDLAAAMLVRESLAPQMLIARGWAAVVPVNGFCDGWHGLGADDPVDPEHHWGQVHVQRSLDFVRADRAGFQASDALYGWGTSAGAAGVVFTSSRYPGFAGLIVDSAPCNLYAYAEQDPLAMTHLMGGIPDPSDSELVGRYDEHSCDRLVADGVVTAPMYVAWNSHDQLVPDEHAESLGAALDAAYPSAGGRYGVHDLAHDAPGTSFHVQTRGGRVPFGYTTELMFRFLEGARVVWAEAEEGCASGCTVGDVVTGSAEPLVSFSGQSGREAPAGSAGVLYVGALPDDVSAGDRVEAVPILTLSGSGGLPESTGVGRLRAGEAVRELTLADFAPEGAAAASDADALIAQYHGTSLVFEASGDTALTLETDGAVDVRLDAIGWILP